ncbi:classical arabinogalactan protein 7-like [Malania oleifera]|uniref:classical arabinogalactan protein 7-like n=1 Tax=Malania oleifera TaxID=397392 RepID=UPI0025AE4323|nr:classical arabinogalactan protein 7-like [Malania oleifera]
MAPKTLSVQNYNLLAETIFNLTASILALVASSPPPPPATTLQPPPFLPAGCLLQHPALVSDPNTTAPPSLASSWQTATQRFCPPLLLSSPAKPTAAAQLSDHLPRQPPVFLGSTAATPAPQDLRPPS